MADTIELPKDANLEEPVKWKPVRDLADAISKLYSDKKIFEFESLEPGAMVFGISTDKKSTRWSDEYANKCTNDSSEEKGCVYLTADVTAPFRLDKLGTDEKNKLEPRVLAFEFAYNPDTYEEYLRNKKLPVLVTQYLIYYEAIENDKPSQENIALCTDALESDLCSVPAVYEFMAIGNLIESRRDKVRKFWDKGNPYSKTKEVSGELYMIIEDKNAADCNIITRVAWAGMNGNGNGNSPINGKRPAEWLNGDVCGGHGRFVGVGHDPWMNPLNPKAITLTGVSWDRQPMSAPSRAGFKPETPQATGYSPPPIGCCAEYIWPSIGLEGGGEGNNFYNPSTLSGLITWADWRKEYQQPLTAKQVEKAKKDTKTIEEIPERHFPCYLAKEYAGDNENAYMHVTSQIQLEYRYQRWIKLSEDTYVRLAPLEFNATEEKKVYLTVPLTIAKIIQPKSYQTAIRKRWYDMLYYSLRNIAGYKTITYKNNQPVEKVIGVTWDPSKVDVEAYLNPCKKQTTSQPTEKCTCDACKYERWKIFELGGEGWRNSDNKTAPFVGTVESFNTYNGACSYNAAQMWQWNKERYNTIIENLANESYDFFPELYFEKLICYDNAKKFNEKAGGFELTEKKDVICECTLCNEPLILPWEGGGKNEICDGSGYYSTHAYTFNKLKYLTQFIIDYKLPENSPRSIAKMEIGEAHSYASTDAVPNATTSNQLTFTGGTKKVSKTVLDSTGEYECISTPNATYTLPLVPAYYQTLSDNEQSTVKVASSIDVKTSKKDKSYGYNAYIWKAFDPGGYVEYHESDIKIKFKQRTLAAACAAPTVVNVFATGITKDSNDVTSGSDDDPLYLYNTDTYKIDYGYRISSSYSCCNQNLLRPGATKDMAVLENNWNADTWEEVIQWCVEEPMLWKQEHESMTDSNYMDPINAGSTALWARDNEETAIGTIDIYLAPVSDGDAAHQYKAKCIGSCSFKVTTEGTSGENCYNSPYQTCASKRPIDADFVVTAQTVTSTPITSGTETVQLIEVEITKQPSKDDPELEAEITIASDILKDKDYTIANDQRQKYIILAARASHTHINSWLAAKGTCDLKGQDAKLKEWAMHYAGACRHAEFETSYEFSREEIK